MSCLFYLSQQISLPLGKSEKDYSYIIIFLVYITLCTLSEIMYSDHVTFGILVGAHPGKTSKVPRDFLLQILGEDRVTKFVIQEIVTSTMADYVKRENLAVKENKINTTQTAEELKSTFAPGKNFGFNAVVELESPEVETSSSTSDDS
ncbi:hypothetical protein EUGRSUZ_A00010 [Eucalyptus grandis]|uniref:Uncharacterized protein n=2 Tax=Eucalyptus grandis TaxID=71139 RepID=A0ACC3LYU6_EUCGR|nr:hypothetical protein EUGRSUZ_A00010 [Eucalyptus grandis]